MKSRTLVEGRPSCTGDGAPRDGARIFLDRGPKGHHHAVQSSQENDAFASLRKDQTRRLPARGGIQLRKEDRIREGLRPGMAYDKQSRYHLTCHSFFLFAGGTAAPGQPPHTAIT